MADLQAGLSAASILAKLLTVDGAGSLLDAATLKEANETADEVADEIAGVLTRKRK